MQQAANTGLLQRTTANVQNSANTSAAYQAQLSSSVSSQLDNITKILKINFNYIDEDLKKSFYNQNLMCNMIETYYLASEQQFASMEGQLAGLGMNSQAPTVQSPQPHQVQYQAVPRLEQGAAAAGPPPPPVPLPSRHVYNVTPAPPPQQQ